MSKVLITGSNSNLGIHLVSKFKKEGHDVLCHNGRHHCDLSTIEGITKLVNEAKEFKVDTLINNVAITCSGKDFGQYTPEEIQNYISVNLTAPILLSYHLMKQLKTIIFRGIKLYAIFNTMLLCMFVNPVNFHMQIVITGHIIVFVLLSSM